MTYEIELRDVSKSYSGPIGVVPALLRTSLDMEHGQFISIVGPSGCGKTTLLRLLAGLIRPSSGVITIGGVAVTEPRREVGFVFQRAVLLPWKSVIDNILLPVKLSHGDRRVAEAKAKALLGLVQLSGFGEVFPGHLSGGMQQRVAICRALMLDPGVLLMDEPFGALDALTREQMGVELLNMWATIGTTVVFVTHSIPEAVFLSDRVLVMSPRPGQIIGDIQIDLPRPRNSELLSSPELARIAGELRSMVAEGERQPTSGIDGFGMAAS